MKQNTVENQPGIINFREDIQKFSISFHQKNTIDSQFTCIVPDSGMIPQNLQKPGTKVVFTGVLVKDPTLPPPRMGGEQVYLLAELRSIE
ncbi:hypothetical protein [Pseudozobellia thermophila]|uniref:Uncharacterized protein n=1 Tax=Pseudozobellia thermophila TaxID=192903 RepID=A0A1M6FJN2_9FLAO|nr:hypothetical protein [Pseudozobellia thermophila]SHI97846.1 hypothetical protein SAMN04488513_102454 [Pseudozobellia thermophila]